MIGHGIKVKNAHTIMPHIDLEPEDAERLAQELIEAAKYAKERKLNVPVKIASLLEVLAFINVDGNPR